MIKNTLQLILEKYILTKLYQTLTSSKINAEDINGPSEVLASG